MDETFLQRRGIEKKERQRRFSDALNLLIVGKRAGKSEENMAKNKVAVELANLLEAKEKYGFELDFPLQNAMKKLLGAAQWNDQQKAYIQKIARAVEKGDYQEAFAASDLLKRTTEAQLASDARSKIEKALDVLGYDTGKIAATKRGDIAPSKEADTASQRAARKLFAEAIEVLLSLRESLVSGKPASTGDWIDDYRQEKKLENALGLAYALTTSQDPLPNPYDLLQANSLSQILNTMVSVPKKPVKSKE
ncbi:MAG: hypothetical protein N3G22_02050 [Candidatus Micrarchaeota archaeon]|nr:hypothetical protein [Candidatus Micrarchaeota archaeon]